LGKLTVARAEPCLPKAFYPQFCVPAAHFGEKSARPASAFHFSLIQKEPLDDFAQRKLSTAFSMKYPG
jgi:hypothetical protein